MTQKMDRSRFKVVILLVLLSNLLGACMAKDVVSKSSGPIFHRLDIDSPTVKWSVDGKLLQQKTPKFVKIEVIEVVNPQNIPLSFNLYYHNNADEDVFLGVFSLFPPNNPGSFIVATSGKLKSGGSISLTLVPLEAITQQQKLWVKIKPFSFFDS